MSIDYPRALLAALGLTVGVAVVVAASTSGAAFGLYNPAWDGAADLRGLAEDAGTEPTVVRNASAYGRVPAEGTVALVLAPAEGYGPAEAASCSPDLAHLVGVGIVGEGGVHLLQRQIKLVGDVRGSAIARYDELVDVEHPDPCTVDTGVSTEDVVGPDYLCHHCRTVPDRINGSA